MPLGTDVPQLHNVVYTFFLLMLFINVWHFIDRVRQTTSIGSMPPGMIGHDHCGRHRVRMTFIKGLTSCFTQEVNQVRVFGRVQRVCDRRTCPTSDVAIAINRDDSLLKLRWHFQFRHGTPIAVWCSWMVRGR